MGYTDRRDFLRISAGSLAIAGTTGSSWLLRRPDDANTSNAIVPDTFPQQDIESVRAVVGASHGNFDKVKELVSARPELAKARYDWGFGDWESALEAASHMGRADIADFLIGHGARPNLFTFTILGKVDTVKSLISEMPGIQSQRGPHGITLLRHAEIRLKRDDLTADQKLAMEEIVDFLKRDGNAHVPQTNLDITESEQKAYSGKFKFGSGDTDYLAVEVNSRGTLAIRRGEDISRAIFRVEEHAFAPTGAPSVRIRFDMKDGWAETVTVHDPIPIVKASRV